MALTLDQMRVLMAHADHLDQGPCDAIRFDQASGDFVRALIAKEDAERKGPHPQSISMCDECKGAQGFSYGLGNWCPCMKCLGTGRK